MVGLGQAFNGMAGAFGPDGPLELVAGADPDPFARRRFHETTGAAPSESLEQLLDRYAVEVVYIATPTALHESQCSAALERGVAVLVEKPIAPTLEAGRRMVNEAARRGTLLMVCHKRSVDRPILAMWRMISSGELGSVCWVHRWHFSDWHYRPRLAGELSPPAGGAVLRQGSHEFDIIRLLAGGSARQLLGFTGDRDPGRPGEGSYVATVQFENEVVATSIYSGYDLFRSDELTFGLLEASMVGAARRSLGAATDEGSSEAEQKRERRRPARGEEVYGFTLVGCEGGDLRAAPGGGIWVYGPAGRRRIEVAGPAGSRFIAEELRQAITEGHPPLHDGRWGLANLELCLAVRDSAREGGPVALTEQCALPAEPLERITGALVREPAEPARP